MSSTALLALVADDDSMILMDACQILEDVGFRYHDVGAGGEAVTVLVDIGRQLSGGTDLGKG